MSQFHIPGNMTVTGSLYSNNSGTISGVIDGDIVVDGKLTVKKEGIINGDISVSNMVVSGKITGNITCSGKLILKSSANVIGNIRTQEIYIEKDALVDGVIIKILEDLDQIPEVEMNESNGFEQNFSQAKAKAELPPETWF